MASKDAQPGGFSRNKFMLTKRRSLADTVSDLAFIIDAIAGGRRAGIYGGGCGSLDR